MTNNKRVGFACSGGGVRAASAVGMIAYIEKLGGKLSAISGSSCGAFIAACYALGYSIDEIRDMMLSFWDKSFYRDYNVMGFVGKKSPFGFLRGKNFYSVFEKVFKDSLFEDVKIPLAINAIDLYKGDIVYFSSKETKKEKIKDAVAASVSIPIVYVPYKNKKKYYIDGGFLQQSPIEILIEFQVEHVITNKVIKSLKKPQSLNSPIKILDQIFTILIKKIYEDNYQKVIKKINVFEFDPDLSNIDTHDIKKINECVEGGIIAINERKEEVKKIFGI